MSSTVHAVATYGRDWYLIVKHLDTDSFRRSVDRAGMRWARSNPAFHQCEVHLIDATYARADGPKPDECLTVLTYQVQRSIR